jgi:hypothetical protein
MVPKATDPLLSPAILDSINTLFQANHLSTDNLQFLYWSYEVLNGAGNVRVVLANAFLNGLPFFDVESGYAFLHDTLINHWEYPYALANNDTTSHQSLATLRQDFIDKATVLMNSFADPVAPFNYADSCLTATLGYMPASWLPTLGFPSNDSILVKVWVVQQVNITFPEVYVQDNNGAAWAPTPAAMDSYLRTPLTY